MSEGKSLEWGRVCRGVGSGQKGAAGGAASSASSFLAGWRLALLLSDAWPRENSHDQLTLEN